jgi:uncharacterized cupredoxin-like copper-binding protein
MQDKLRFAPAMMMKFPGMGHDETHVAHVDPGKEMVMSRQFTNPGTVHLG